MIELRRATAGDVDAVLAIDHVAARAPRLAQHVAAGHVIVAVDGTVIGFAVLTDSFFDSPFIDLVVVVPAARRRGIARALVDRCVLAHSNEKVWTSTNASNSAMRALLAKAGFRRSGRIDNLDPGDPELVYVRLPPQGVLDRQSTASLPD